MRQYGKLIAVLLVLIFAFGLAGCSSTQIGAKKAVLGVAPGPYGDLVKYAIKPGLEKKGYLVDIKEFSDWVQPNFALANKEIDANVFQHRLYLEKFSHDKGLKLSPLIRIPTAGMGLYSRKLNIKNVDELKNVIKPGDEITLPNDPTNMARALRFLTKNNVITIKADADAAKASEKDIDANPYNLRFSPVEAAQLPRTLDSVALSVVPGNYAIAAGISLSAAIVLEELTEDIKITIAVRTEDLDKQLANDIKEVVESEDFYKVIEDPKLIFKNFQKPDWYKAKWKI